MCAVFEIRNKTLNSKCLQSFCLFYDNVKPILAIKKNVLSFI